MKVYTLMENTAVSPDFRTEHGLSLYIETGNQKLLFDAGQSDAFVYNAEKLGIDLSAVDMAVLSHGHYDHGGGLETFLKVNDHAPVYVSPLAFEPYYNASNRYIGLNPQLKDSGRCILTEKVCALGEGISLLPGSVFVPQNPINSFGLQKKTGSCLVPDDFLHEQYLLLEEHGKRVLLSGCSHRGILNIVDWIPCDVMVGGFHFSKLDPQSGQLRSSAQTLLGRETVYYTCHCTGKAQYGAMEKIMGQKLRYLAAGSILEIMG